MDRSGQPRCRHVARATWVALLASVATIAVPQERAARPDAPGFNFGGTTGLVDTPIALDQPDGTLGLNASSFAGVTRTTLSFQVFPRVQGAFRYAGAQDLNFAGFEDYYDRSFDLSLRLLDEGRYLPAVKVGLQDFIGTGLYSGEYVVATKSVTPSLQVTAGLGWGRLAGENDIGTPFGARPAIDIGVGGEANAETWFRGPAAPFGGVSFQATDRLTLLADYSSDGYLLETGRDPDRDSAALFDRESSVNLGLRYRFNPNVTLGASYLYGSTFGANLTFTANPDRPPVAGPVGPAPGKVLQRPDRAAAPEAYATGWTAVPGATATQLRVLSEQLAGEGILLESLEATADTATVRIRNQRYDAEAQAIGRTARALTRVMPASVETFRIVPVQDGLPLSAVTLRRTDLEANVTAPNGAARLLAVTGFDDAGPRGADAVVNDALFPRLGWSIGPYVRQGYFDPDAPFRIDVGVRAGASYEPVPGLILSGAVTQKLAGNLDGSERLSNSVLPRVRTDSVLYAGEGDTALAQLTAAYYFRPGRDLYGRVTAGYLEQMFGGVSGEVLWKPVTSRLGLGVEVNYARQRDYDQGFGFRDYDVATGHVSAYYDLGSGYRTQVDVGRYLAGDVGGTFALDRDFRNGWSVGAFATLTDVSAEEFGEGSFDKGIRLSIPLSWFTGAPTRNAFGTTLRPITRDGGAKLNVPGRLAGRVRDYDAQRLEDEWGRVWR